MDLKNQGKFRFRLGIFSYCFLNWGQFVCPMVIFVVCHFLVLLSLVVSTSAIDCVERLVPEIIGYVSTGMLNFTYLLTVYFFKQCVYLRCLVICC